MSSTTWLQTPNASSTLPIVLSQVATIVPVAHPVFAVGFTQLNTLPATNSPVPMHAESGLAGRQSGGQTICHYAKQSRRVREGPGRYGREGRIAETGRRHESDTSEMEHDYSRPSEKASK